MNVCVKACTENQERHFNISLSTYFDLKLVQSNHEISKTIYNKGYYVYNKQYIIICEC